MTREEDAAIYSPGMETLRQKKASDLKNRVAMANQLEKVGNHAAYEQVMAAVSDFEKGNMRLTVVLQSLE